MNSNNQKNMWFNFTVNTLDGAFFGLGIGFASFGTILPLFVNQFTESAILIGLIPAIHVAGLQFPPLLTASFMARQKWFKPWILLISINERLPFLLWALVAWMMDRISPSAAVSLG